MDPNADGNFIRIEPDPDLKNWWVHTFVLNNFNLVFEDEGSKVCVSVVYVPAGDYPDEDGAHQPVLRDRDTSESVGLLHLNHVPDLHTQGIS